MQTLILSSAEMEFMKADIPVFSNAKNYRRHSIVPLVMPPVNLSHLGLIPHQRKHFGLKKGFFGLQFQLYCGRGRHPVCCLSSRV